MGLTIKDFKQTSQLKNDNLFLLEQQTNSNNVSVDELVGFVKSNVENFTQTDTNVSEVELSVANSETKLKLALAKHEESKKLLAYILSEKGYQTYNDIDSIIRSINKLKYQNKSAVYNGILYTTIGGELFELNLNNIIVNVRDNKMVVALLETYLNEKHKVTALYNGKEYVLSQDDKSIFTVFIQEYEVPQELIGQSFNIKVEVAGETVITDINKLEENDKLSKWVEISDMPINKTLGDSVKHGDIVYFECGDSKLSRINAKSYEELPQIVIPDNQANANLCLVNDNIYTISGYNNKNVNIYNITLGTWTSTTQILFSNSSSNNSCIYNNGAIYCFFDNHDYEGQMMKYNINTNTWSLIPNNDSYISSSKPIVLNGSIYVIGGEPIDDGKSNKQIRVYNDLTNTYTIKRILKYETAYVGATVFDGKILMLGGTDGDKKVNRVFEYNPVTNKLKELLRMFYPCKSAKAFAVDDKVVLFSNPNQVKGLSNISQKIFEYQLF